MCNKERFELFQRKALYKYLLLLYEHKLKKAEIHFKMHHFLFFFAESMPPFQHPLSPNKLAAFFVVVAMNTDIFKLKLD